jgi:acid phosphatase
MEIVEENHSLQDIIGNGQAPYINSLALQYGLATNWNDLSHPSLPNYLGLTSGSIWDNPQDTTPQQGTYPGPSVVDELNSAGVGWKAYIEDMPQACDLTDTFSPANYDVNHNPFMYYDSIRNNPAQCNRDVPFTQFATDLNNNTAPPFMWVSPNLQNDMHDGTIAQGDQWLQQQLAIVFSSQWYQQGGTIVLTWDEGVTTEQVATIVISASTPAGGRIATFGSHYGTLRTIEELYSVGFLGSSASASQGDLQALIGTLTPTPTSTPTSTPTPTPTPTPITTPTPTPTTTPTPTPTPTATPTPTPTPCTRGHSRRCRP